MNATRRNPVWDLPTRLFHWCLPVLMALAWASAEFGRMDVHAWCGYAVIVLVAFRLCWGVVGSTHSRFTDFLRGPGAVAAYLRGAPWTREGHNPAGGWSVLLMLLLLLSQAVSGLFNEDDIAFSGPLAHLANAYEGLVHEWHEVNFWLLAAVVALHVAAVGVYARRGRNLLRPMLDGGTTGEGARTAPAWLALLLLAGCGILLWWLLSLAPKPQVFL